MCPKGNDVMDERQNLETSLKYQTQRVTLIAAGALGDGKMTVTGCGADAAYTDAATDACFVDLVGKSFALTFTSKLNQSYTTKPIIVQDVYPSVKCAIKFDGGSVAGPQYLLEVEADKCDSGCTPQLSSPVQLKSALVASTAAAANVKAVESSSDGGVADTTVTTVDLAAGGGALFGGDAEPAELFILVGSEIMKVTKVDTDAP